MSSLILLLAVILIFKTLFSNFGFTSTDKRDNEEDKAINEFLKQKFEKEYNSTTDNEIKKVFVVNLGKEDESLKTAEENLKKESELYTADTFLKQIEKVVETIVYDFASFNKTSLKELLSSNLFQVFSNEIDKNINAKLTLKSAIISFDEKKFLTDFNTNSEKVSVALTMKQINYIEDENKNIIHGDKNNYSIIKEVWTFVKNHDKNIGSPWLVDSISEYK